LKIKLKTLKQFGFRLMVGKNENTQVKLLKKCDLQKAIGFVAAPSDGSFPHAKIPPSDGLRNF
jgi:hypothetical protein